MSQIIMGKEVNRNSSGISLVEIMLGLTVLLIVFTIGLVIQRNLTKGSVTTDLNVRAAQKLRSSADYLRYVASDQFDQMNETPQQPLNYDPLQSPDIKIYSTVGPINNASQTRLVTLKAVWMDGSIQKSTTTSFSLMYVQAMKSGAVIHLKVVDATNPTNGVGNFKVSAPSININETVYTHTAGPSEGLPPGEAMLYGARTGGSLPVTLEALYGSDQTFPNYYQFHTSSGYQSKIVINISNPLPGTVDNTFFTAPTQTSGSGDPISGPLVAYPPGSFKVNVKDKNSGNPITNYFVRLIYDPPYDTFPFPPGQGGEQLTGTSGPNLGTAFYGPLLQLIYYPFAFGNEIYAAVDSAYSNNHWDLNKYKNTVVPGNTVSANMATLARGSVQGTVHGLAYDSVNTRWIQSGVVPNMGFTLTRVPTSVSVDHFPSPDDNIDMEYSFYWQHTFPSDTAWYANQPWHPRDAIWPVTSDGGGTYRADNIAPLVLSDDASLSQQYGPVNVTPYVDPSQSDGQPITLVPDPYIPVYVLPKSADMNHPATAPTSVATAWNLSDVKLLINRWNDYGGGNTVENTFVWPVQYPLTDWYIKLKANTVQTGDLYLLKKDCMSNVLGNIYFNDGSGGKAAPFTTPSQLPYAAVDFNGSNEGNVGYLVSPGSSLSYYFSISKEISTTYNSTTHRYSYDMHSDPAVPHPLLMNLPGEQTQIDFNGATWDNDNATFQDYVTLLRKERVSVEDSAGSYDPYVRISHGDTNIQNLIIYMESYSNPISVNVSGGKINFTHTVTVRQNYSGYGKGILVPGDSNTIDIVLNNNIASHDYYWYRLWPDHNGPSSDWEWHYEGDTQPWWNWWRYWYNPTNATGGPYKEYAPDYDPMKIWEAANAREISGQVTLNGTPVTGIQVYLTRIDDGTTGGSHWTGPYPTPAVTGSDGRFAFHDIPFNTSPNPELMVSVNSASGLYCMPDPKWFHGYAYDQVGSDPDHRMVKTDANIILTPEGQPGCMSSGPLGSGNQEGN